MTIVAIKRLSVVVNGTVINGYEWFLMTIVAIKRLLMVVVINGYQLSMVVDDYSGS